MRHYIYSVSSLIVFLLLVGPSFNSPLQADTYKVTTTVDSVGAQSIRGGIVWANSNFGKDTIEFDLPDSSKVHVLKIDSSLPCIKDTLVIDGFTQPGASPNTNNITQGINAEPEIMLYNNDSVRVGLCLRYNTADESVIRGLIIPNFGDPGSFNKGVGINIASASKVSVEGCFIGVDSTGKRGYFNQRIGVLVDSMSNFNRIGDTVPAARNLISGLQYRGVFCRQGYTSISEGNKIVGNYIGVNKSGQGYVKQASDTTNELQPAAGILLSQGNVVGGKTRDHRNVILGTSSNGIQVVGDSNSIGGNFIGVTADGRNILSDTIWYGIKVESNYNQIGAPGYENVIAGCNYGIGFAYDFDYTMRGNIISNNFIGTDKSKKKDWGNYYYGIYMYEDSGAFDCDDIKYNVIGAIGPNRGGNVIANNGRGGIKLEAAGITDPTNCYSMVRNRIKRNVFWGNGGPEITLVDSANLEKSPPVISSITKAGFNKVDITGSSIYGDSIEIYWSKNNQAFRYITTVVTNSMGVWSATNVPVKRGIRIKATATDTFGNTSTFSPPQSLPSSRIFGQVFTPSGDTVRDSTIVYGYRIDSNRTAMTLVDRDTLGKVSGYDTYFLKMPMGRYVVWAQPNKNKFDNVYPTYFRSSAKWSKAKELKLGTDTTGVDIKLIKANKTLNGEGIISGQVVEGKNYNKRTQGDPLANVNCAVVETGRDSIYQYTTTDDSGKFTFNNLPEGNYDVRPELPGVPVDTGGLNDFDVDKSGTIYDSVRVEVDSEQVTVTKQKKVSGVKTVSESAVQLQHIYPNPVKDYINIKLINKVATSRTVTIKILDVTGGQKLKSQKINLEKGVTTKRIKTSTLPAGVLFVRVSSSQGETLYHTKLVHIK